MIEVKDLSLLINGRIAVEQLNFKIYNGKTYGVLGADGAGKSSLLEMIAGATEPTCGSVRINGFDLKKSPIKARRCVGFLPSLNRLYPSFTAYELLCFIADAKGVAYEKARRQVHDAIELIGLDAEKDRQIKFLSRLSQRKLAIAQTLLGNADIVILDEPLRDLDKKETEVIEELIRKIAQMRTVILSGNDPAQICALCDHVLVLAQGKLIANAPVDELREVSDAKLHLKLTVRGDREGITEVLSSIPEIESYTFEAEKEDGVASLRLSANRADDLRDRIFFAMADHRYALISMESEAESAETIFQKLQSAADEARKNPQARGSTEENERDGEYELIEEENN